MMDDYEPPVKDKNRYFQSRIPHAKNKYIWREDLNNVFERAKEYKWEYGFTDTLLLICGLAPRKVPKTGTFNEYDAKTYRIEDCTHHMTDYKKQLDDRGWTDPWIRVEVPLFHKMNTTKFYTNWQLIGRMLVPGIICGYICAQIKKKYFTYDDYEGREEEWKHYKYAKHH